MLTESNCQTDAQNTPTHTKDKQRNNKYKYRDANTKFQTGSLSLKGAKQVRQGYGENQRRQCPRRAHPLTICKVGPMGKTWQDEHNALDITPSW